MRTVLGSIGSTTYTVEDDGWVHDDRGPVLRRVEFDAYYGGYLVDATPEAHTAAIDRRPGIDRPSPLHDAYLALRGLWNDPGSGQFIKKGMSTEKAESLYLLQGGMPEPWHDVREAARNADDRTVLARVVDNRMKRGGLNMGDVVPVRYRSDDKAQVQITARNGGRRWYDVQWQRFEAVASVNVEPETPAREDPAVLRARVRDKVRGLGDNPFGAPSVETLAPRYIEALKKAAGTDDPVEVMRRLAWPDGTDGVPDQLLEELTLEKVADILAQVSRPGLLLNGRPSKFMVRNEVHQWFPGLNTASLDRADDSGTEFYDRVVNAIVGPDWTNAELQLTDLDRQRLAVLIDAGRDLLADHEMMVAARRTTLEADGWALVQAKADTAAATGVAAQVAERDAQALLDGLRDRLVVAAGIDPATVTWRPPETTAGAANPDAAIRELVARTGSTPDGAEFTLGSLFDWRGDYPKAAGFYIQGNGRAPTRINSGDLNGVDEALAALNVYAEAERVHQAARNAQAALDGPDVSAIPAELVGMLDEFELDRHSGDDGQGRLWQAVTAALAADPAGVLTGEWSAGASSMTLTVPVPDAVQRSTRKKVQSMAMAYANGRVSIRLSIGARNNQRSTAWVAVVEGDRREWWDQVLRRAEAQRDIDKGVEKDLVDSTLDWGERLVGGSAPVAVHRGDGGRTDMLNDVARVLPDGVKDAAPAVVLENYSGQRGFYKRATRDAPGRLSVRAGARSTMLHEYGHHIEQSFPELNDALWAFYVHRTGGAETPMDKLQKLFQGWRYSDGELTRPDEFFDAYAGKGYAETERRGRVSAYEVFTMGLEGVFTRRKGRASGNGPTRPIDDEHAAFILGVLAWLDAQTAGDVSEPSEGQVVATTVPGPVQVPLLSPSIPVEVA